jgi:hypothetical protein
VLGLVLTAVEMAERERLLHGVDASFSNASREALDGILADSDATAGLLARLSPAARDAAREAAGTAYTTGFRTAMLVAAALAAVAGIATLLLLPRRAPHHDIVPAAVGVGVPKPVAGDRPPDG